MKFCTDNRIYAYVYQFMRSANFFLIMSHKCSVEMVKRTNTSNYENNNKITERASLKADAELFPAIFAAHVLSVCTG